MNTRSSRILGLLPVALLIGLLVVPQAHAQKRGGHSGGHVGRPPRVNAPHQTYKPPRMPHATTPSHANLGISHARANNARNHATNTQARATNAQAHATNVQPRTTTAQTRPTNAPTHANLAVAAARRQATSGALYSNGTGVSNPSGTAPNSAIPVLSATGATPTSLSPYSYTYGTGNGARGYRAYGYGSGYRNRSYGRGYGYGRSQGYNRGLVARLRSVHQNLAQLDRDYGGHRVRAMQSISMAVRQLSHRSMGYNTAGFTRRMNTGPGMGMRRAGLGAGGRRSRLMTMTQAQSDARMSQALRTLQGINMQLHSQGTMTGHAMASGHVQQAIQHLNIALSIR